MHEQAQSGPDQPGAPGDFEEFVEWPDGDNVWRLVGGDYYDVSGDSDDKDGEEYDPAAAQALLQRTIACLERPSVGVTREQLARLQQRRAAQRAERARAERMKARNESARQARPEATTNARPRTSRTRRPATRQNAASASPQPPDPAPAPAIPAIIAAPVTAAPTAAKISRSSRAVSAKPLDPRLRPFAHALADLLLADLLKYPPEKS